ncbi:DUF4129 domain-containing protein [Kineococcus rubinsiae]|uniref:DUF4129 domain-containing protein n=1 Tax=Kineococcus rubinsiae TaxID=2609562 RepID=UPI00142FBD05|nr:DUF4129 domain-containing protein [Kineococcus rubinsiae]NIZ93082.1 DUF4129 domain-containing protein [Kineococcus rubinsiae]
MSGLLRLGAPLVPDAGQARELLARELAGGEYRGQEEPWLQRVWTWVTERLDRVQVPGLGTSWTGPLLVVLVLVAVVVVVLAVAGPVRRGARAPEADAAFDDLVPAAEHHRRADAAAAAGQWSVAVQERFRAVVRSLEERALLERRPGRTAHEVAEEAAVPLPACAAGLRRAARTFDDVRYGGRTASPEVEAEVRRLAAEVAATRPRALADAPDLAGRSTS